MPQDTNKVINRSNNLGKNRLLAL